MEYEVKKAKVRLHPRLGGSFGIVEQIGAFLHSLLSTWWLVWSVVCMRSGCVALPLRSSAVKQRCVYPAVGGPDRAPRRRAGMDPAAPPNAAPPSHQGGVPPATNAPFAAPPPHLAHLFSSSGRQAAQPAPNADILSELDNVAFALHQGERPPSRQMDALDAALRQQQTRPPRLAPQPPPQPQPPPIPPPSLSLQQQLELMARHGKSSHAFSAQALANNPAAFRQSQIMAARAEAHARAVAAARGASAAANTPANIAHMQRAQVQKRARSTKAQTQAHMHAQMYLQQQQQMQQRAMHLSPPQQQQQQRSLHRHSSGIEPTSQAQATLNSQHIRDQQLAQLRFAHEQAQQQQALQQARQVPRQRTYSQWPLPPQLANYKQSPPSQSQPQRPAVPEALSASAVPIARNRAASITHSQSLSTTPPQNAPSARAHSPSMSPPRAPTHSDVDLARTVFEVEIEAARKRQRLDLTPAKHQMQAMEPDVARPFTDCFDAWQRLLPYHTMLAPEATEGESAKRDRLKDDAVVKYRKWSRRLETAILDAVTDDATVPAEQSNAAPVESASISANDSLLISRMLFSEEQTAVREAKRQREAERVAAQRHLQAQMRARAQAVAHAQAQAANAHAHVESSSQAHARPSHHQAQTQQQPAQSRDHVEVRQQAFKHAQATQPQVGAAAPLGVEQTRTQPQELPPARRPPFGAHPERLSMVVSASAPMSTPARLPGLGELGGLPLPGLMARPPQRGAADGWQYAQRR